MSDDERSTRSVERMQASIVLARRNVELLKKQAAEPKPLRSNEHTVAAAAAGAISTRHHKRN